MVHQMARERAQDQIARFSLMAELHTDQQLWQMLAPTHSHIVDASIALLEALGSNSPVNQAHDLLTLIEGLLFDHIIGTAQSDPQRTFTTYFDGVAAHRAR